MRYEKIADVDNLTIVQQERKYYFDLKETLKAYDSPKGHMNEIIRIGYLKIAWMQTRFNFLETKSLLKYSRDSSFDKNERKTMKKIIQIRKAGHVV
jgi:hypothetical protein